MNAFDGRNLPWTKLPFFFDPQPLRSEVEAIAQAEWKPHFNSGDYAGDWSSVSLRSRSGRVNDIVPGGGSAADFSDTPLMASCPHLRDAVKAFQFPQKAVRLLRLHAGSRVKEHSDRDLGLADGELRIHVPVVTNEQVEFVVANRRLILRAGESWFIDFSQPHRIDNGGAEHRVHLVIDGTLNLWAEELLLRSAREIATETSVPAGVAEVERFRELVYSEPDLMAALLRETEPEEFVAAVLAVGERQGCAFKPADVESVMLANRREWTTRLTGL